MYLINAHYLLLMPKENSLIHFGCSFSYIIVYFLTCSHRVYIYFFPVPRAGLFSVKIRKKFLAIKNFSINETMSGQPNERLIH